MSTLALVLAGFFGLGLYAQRVISQYPGFASAGTTDTTPTPIQIGGRTYNVPANYSDSAANQAGKQEALLLLALWPKMEGRTNENRSQMNVGHAGQKVRVLLKTSRSGNPSSRGVEIALEVGMKNDAPMEYSGHAYGLDHYVPVNGRTMLNRDEYFIRKRGEKVESFARCPLGGSVPYPNCESWFPVTDFIWAKVTYGKPLFPEWREIQSSVLALMQRFEANGQTAPSPLHARGQ